MLSTSTKTSHLERTAAEPRDRFLAGQWLDVFVPGIPKPGGFTITSPPSRARPGVGTGASVDPESRPGYVELAIQKSPDNPPAAWLWRDPPSPILGRELRVRVGGSFVWPPPGIDVGALRRVVFVAGGVGVNPLVSMLSDIAEKGGAGFEARFLYSMRDPGGGKRDATQMLFLERLQDIFGGGKLRGRLQLYLTGGAEESGSLECGDGEVNFVGRRIDKRDLEEAVGSVSDRRFAVAYVCGVPTMTDGFVKDLTDKDGLGMASRMVLYVSHCAPVNEEKKKKKKKKREK
ncbi:hypothetical protein TruAng_000629 [Truncatella angustata]|nr:hypothetical protein TruAng_000629 [Truncatella angustata]